MMKEKPILFSGPMVNAILAGNKTVTRRVVKRGLDPGDIVHNIKPYQGEWIASGVTDTGCGFIGDVIPPCDPGDLLWVRETWAHYQTVNIVRRPDGRSFGEISDGRAGYKADGFDSIEDFRAHIRLMHGSDLEALEINGDRWRPSIFMPRWASRINLEVVDVRAERLHEITDADAQAEGVDGRYQFAALWDSLNAKRGYGWAVNPWVYRIEFRRVK
jgi:hypothetical protein